MENYVLGEIRLGREIGMKSHRAKFMWIECPYCKNKRWVLVLKGKTTSLYCVHCSRKGEQGIAGRKLLSKINKGRFVGNKSHAWKGGKCLTSGGYVVISLYPGDPFYRMGSHNPKKSPRSETSEHRLVMARHLGRCLKKNEIVHHKNGIKDDNRIENLELISNSKHLKEHSRGYADGFNKGYKDGMRLALAN